MGYQLVRMSVCNVARFDHVYCSMKPDGSINKARHKNVNHLTFVSVMPTCAVGDVMGCGIRFPDRDISNIPRGNGDAPKGETVSVNHKTAACGVYTVHALLGFTHCHICS